MLINRVHAFITSNVLNFTVVNSHYSSKVGFTQTHSWYNFINVNSFQAQRLELEKKHLEMIIETLKKQHEEELKMMEESFK